MRRPAEAFDPRELFREELDARGIADDELVKTLHTWLHGGEFTDAVSDCLSLMLGTSTSLWIALHAAWREGEVGVMTDEELVARALTQAKLNGAILCGVESWEGSRRTDHVSILTVDYDALSSAVVAALREAGRLVPDGVTVRYGWQSGESSPGAWSASRVAVDQP